MASYPDFARRAREAAIEDGSPEEASKRARMSKGLFLLDLQKTLTGVGYVEGMYGRMRYPLDCVSFNGEEGRLYLFSVVKGVFREGIATGFVLSMSGLISLLGGEQMIYAMKNVALQVRAEGEEFLERVDDLRMKLSRLYTAVLGRRTEAAVPFVHMGKGGSSFVLPIWNAAETSEKEGKTGDGPTMRIDVYEGAFVRGVGVPFFEIFPPAQRGWKINLSAVHPGEGKPTVELRECPIFAEADEYVNSSAGIYFGHLGTMFTYFVSRESDGTMGAVGHIHGGRFKRGRGDRPFDTATRTIVPAPISPDDLVDWSKRFPSTDPGKSTPTVQRVLEEMKGNVALASKTLPSLPWAMYGPTIAHATAILTEAVHWWAAFAAANGNGSASKIVAVMRDGGMLLAIPPLTTPMQVAGKPFYGGIVGIEKAGDRAVCWYVNEKGEGTAAIPTTPMTTEQLLATADLATGIALREYDPFVPLQAIWPRPGYAPCPPEAVVKHINRCYQLQAQASDLFERRDLSSKIAAWRC